MKQRLLGLLVCFAAIVGSAALYCSLFIEPSGAADPANQPPPPYPRGYQQITSLSSATSLTIPTGGQIALIQAETQSIRMRDDGTDPDATVGFLISAGDVLEYDGDLRDVRLIETAASAKANILYYGF